jgi:S-adenosylmethionine decarboxylase
MQLFGKTSNIFSNTLVENFMIVGTEWLIEAEGCNAGKLRDLHILQAVFARVISDLGLKTVGEINWHKFEGEGGVTGLAMLTESHLACHTYPEHQTATFNLYCCRSRPEWNWEENLKILLEAESVRINKIERGNPQSAIQNPKSKSVGGEI